MKDTALGTPRGWWFIGLWARDTTMWQKDMCHYTNIFRHLSVLLWSLACCPCLFVVFFIYAFSYGRALPIYLLFGGFFFFAWEILFRFDFNLTVPISILVPLTFYKIIESIWRRIRIYNEIVHQYLNLFVTHVSINRLSTLLNHNPFYLFELEKNPLINLRVSTQNCIYKRNIYIYII